MISEALGRYTMMHLLLTLITAFVVSFVTVLLPNPSTLAAGRIAMRDGMPSAEFFLAAVVLMDAVVFFVLVVGVHPLMRFVGVAEYLVPVAGMGLLVFGVYMMIAAKRDALTIRERKLTRAQVGHGPILTGFLVPAANPGYWIWWTTVGTSFIHSVRPSGVVGLGALMVAMLGGAATWYLLLLRALSHGRGVFNTENQGRIFFLLGIVMAGFGVSLILRTMGLLP